MDSKTTLKIIFGKENMRKFMSGETDEKIPCIIREFKSQGEADAYTQGIEDGFGLDGYMRLSKEEYRQHRNLLKEIRA